MRRILLLLLMIGAVACKDDSDPLYGSIKATIDLQAVGDEQLPLQLGLLDIASGYDVSTGVQYWSQDVLYTISVYNGSGTFDEVLPGDYRVVLLGKPNFFHAVQVKAGQQASVSLP